LAGVVFRDAGPRYRRPVSKFAAEICYAIGVPSALFSSSAALLVWLG
jgi:hypothetical protein